MDSPLIHAAEGNRVTGDSLEEESGGSSRSDFDGEDAPRAIEMEVLGEVIGQLI